MRIDASTGRHLAFAPVAFAVTEGPTHTVIYGNAIFRRMQQNGDIRIGSYSPSVPQATDLTPVLDRVFQSGLTERDAVLEPTGQGPAAWSCTVWPVTGSGSMLEKLVVEVRDVAELENAKAEQRALAESLLLGALREQDVARNAVRASDRASYLARVSRELGNSLDDDATRETVRRMTLPRPGTWSIVDVVESDGGICRLPVSHPDPVKQALAQTLVPVEVAAPIERQTREGAGLQGEQTSTGESVGALMLAAHGEANLLILRQIGFGSLLVVPLIVRARLQGTITFVSRAGDAPFTPEEIALAMDVGARCAMALDNARLYREADSLRVAAQAANESKSEFLSRMSHELRTPLNAIGGFAELIAMGIQGPVTEVQHVALSRIKANQQHLLVLISDILNFARIESGRVEYRLSEVPLEPAMAEVGKMLSVAIAEKRLTLRGPEPDTGVVAWADPERVKQIIMNLLMNAVKYMHVDGGTITLRSEIAGGLALAHIEDTGPGIPAEQLESIFEPFVQLTGGLTDRKGGVGLGLAISRDLARAMGGDLTVESTVNVGSCFTLSLAHAPSPQLGPTASAN
jgi:signal transduction histidine kinase